MSEYSLLSSLLLELFNCWKVFIVILKLSLFWILILPHKISMEFIEGSRGVYRPIKVLFDTPLYEQALQICWHIQSYKTQIALVLLKLQQKRSILQSTKLLKSPGNIPPCFQHPKLKDFAQEYGRNLREQLKAAPTSKLLSPSEVVMEVPQKVVQAFWVLP